jgi:hypothetical protein
MRQTTVPSPNVMIQNLGNGTCRIRFDGIPGETYRIQYTENLQVPDWQLLGSATADDSGEVQIIDTPPA